jgi:hypothetical protein
MSGKNSPRISLPGMEQEIKHFTAKSLQADVKLKEQGKPVHPDGPRFRKMLNEMEIIIKDLIYTGSYTGPKPTEYEAPPADLFGTANTPSTRSNRKARQPH